MTRSNGAELNSKGGAGLHTHYDWGDEVRHYSVPSVAKTRGAIGSTVSFDINVCIVSTAPSISSDVVCVLFL